MIKVLLMIILNAICVLLLALTGIAVKGALGGTLPPMHDLVELCVGWLVVFVTFYAAFVKTIFRRW